MAEREDTEDAMPACEAQLPACEAQLPASLACQFDISIQVGPLLIRQSLEPCMNYVGMLTSVQSILQVSRRDFA